MADYAVVVVKDARTSQDTSQTSLDASRRAGAIDRSYRAFEKRPPCISRACVRTALTSLPHKPGSLKSKSSSGALRPRRPHPRGAGYLIVPAAAAASPSGDASSAVQFGDAEAQVSRANLR